MCRIKSLIEKVEVVLLQMLDGFQTKLGEIKFRRVDNDIAIA